MLAVNGAGHPAEVRRILA